MTHFPEPVKLPDYIPKEREERNRKLIRSALIGISIRTAIIISELVGVALFNSSALFLDALSSLLDVASTVFLIIFIKLAARPPDANHPFGHGRFEPIAGLQLGLMLCLIGGGMFIQQVTQFSYIPKHEVLDNRTWIIPFIAMILLEICYRVVMYAAKKKHSPAFAADALHYRIDGINSLFATIVLLLGAFIPEWSIFLDHLGAVIIAFLMVVIGIWSMRSNLNQLMDHVPESEFFDKVRKASRRVIGVLGTEKIRIQIYGPDAHVDIDVEVDPKLTVEVAHGISQNVRAEIQKEWPAVQDVTVHIEPFYENDH